MKIKRLFTKVRNDAACRVRNLLAKPHPSPIFVLGHQKSGTTAIASLLSACAQLPFSSDFFYRTGCRDVVEYCDGRVSMQRIIARHKLPFSFPIIKDPDLTYFYDELRTAFPSAKFVFVVRDPRQNIRSIFDRLGIDGAEQDIGGHRDIETKLPGWWIQLTGRAPRIEGVNHVENLAKRWVIAANAYLANSDMMELIRYEDFVADKKASIESLCNRLGIAPKQDISDSMDIQYQPRGKPCTDIERFFGARNLELVEAACQEAMPQFGYQAISRSAEP